MRLEIVPIIAGLFALVFIGRAGAMLGVSAAPADKTPVITVPDATFTELDRWQDELTERAKEIDAQKVAADLAMAEAVRQTRESERDQTRNAMTIERAKKLATVYGSMEPELAGETLAAWPTEKSALVVAEMAPDVAGPILAAMPRQTSQDIAGYLLLSD